MVEDIRLAVGFWNHPKIKKLKRKFGLEGPVALQTLWIWAAINKPDGDLSGMDNDAIELAAEWEGADGEFISALSDLHLLDGTDNEYSLHNWQKKNSWAAESINRSERNRFIGLAKTDPQKYKELKGLGVNALSREDYDRIMAGCRPDDEQIASVAQAGSKHNATAPQAERERDASVTQAESIYNASPTPITNANAITTTIPNTDTITIPKKEKTPDERTAAPTSGYREREKVPDLNMDEARAFKTVTEMYYICPDYLPEAPQEMKFIRELSQDYPGVPLAAQFHKARDWLKDHPDKLPKNLLSFLRRWIEKAAKEYKDGKKILGYRDVIEFVPAEEGSVVNA